VRVGGRLRTLLYVPGDRPERIPKALASGADCAVVDLEDAVAPGQKSLARAETVRVLAAQAPGACRVGVRVNALGSGLLTDDLAALAPVWERIDVVLLPMTPDAATVRECVGMFEALEAEEGPAVVPMVETAAGVLAAAEIAAASPRVLTVALGPADLSAELGVTLTPDGVELLHVRSRLVLAAAAAGRVGPIDGPWLDVADGAGLAGAAAGARRLGFSGMQLIHPAQVDAATRAFAPTAAELDRARAVDAAFRNAESRGIGSIRLDDGTFVDLPVAVRARALLAYDE
jgi:citrate lyase subunit beta/citryl-CoA lyase